MVDTQQDRDTPSRTGSAGPSGAKQRRRLSLSLGTRVLSFAVGWSLILVGVVGLALPGIQGVLTILIGAAVLSVVSETVYRLLKRFFHRWPWAWTRIERFRNRLHDWLHREK